MMADDGNKRSIKVVVVGDGAVGKTSLLYSYTRDSFPLDHVPTVFDTYTADVTIDAGKGPQVVELNLWDTAGQQELDHARKISYPGSDAFLVCFSVDNKDSFEHVRNKWFPEVSKQTSSAANPVYVLVGTKLDLRDGVPEGMQVATQPPPASGSESVSTEQGKALAAELGMHAYVECSALTQDNLKSVFDTTIKAVLAPKQSEGAGGCCTIQ